MGCVASISGNHDLDFTNSLSMAESGANRKLSVSGASFHAGIPWEPRTRALQGTVLRGLGRAEGASLGEPPWCVGRLSSELSLPVSVGSGHVPLACAGGSHGGM